MDKDTNQNHCDAWCFDKRISEFNFNQYLFKSVALYCIKCGFKFIRDLPTTKTVPMSNGRKKQKKQTSKTLGFN